jgi:hypothetical protein
MEYIYVIVSVPDPNDQDDGIKKYLDMYNKADNNNLNEDISTVIQEGDFANMLIAALPEGTPEEQDAALLVAMHIDVDRR